MNSCGTLTLFDYRGKQVYTKCDLCRQKHAFDGDWLTEQYGDLEMPSLLKPLGLMLECPRVDNTYSDRCRLVYGEESRETPKPVVEQRQIIRIADLAENEGLIVICQGCGRKRDLARWSVVANFGGGTEIGSLEPRMKCLCGHKGARIEIGRMKR
ncbi:hypothetical protein G6K93_05670 [Agrobacterium rhizogenes]|nr:hypothetical protein [Rhizobium rhizogenes]NTJ46501.1 hypothetical protein [Rhizobium rhizogenes]